MAENRVIGRNNTLPWHLPADLKRFRSLTTGHTLIMGRKTFESIGRPLAGRRIVVLTRDRGWRGGGGGGGGVEVAHDWHQVIAAYAGAAELFVAGGADVYRLALPLADRVYLTVVHASVTGDAHFPVLDDSVWRLVEDERHDGDEKNPFPYSFRRYERVRATGNVQRTTV
jgi:dihydrofolate reductase